MNFLQTLFRRRKPRKIGPPNVSICLNGPPNVGKTVLMQQLSNVLVHNPLPSGLRVVPLGPRRLVECLDDRRESEVTLHSRSVESTLNPKKHLYAVYQGEQERARVLVCDTRGQLLKCGRRITQETADDYDTYLSRLAQCDVSWHCLPCLPNSHSAADVQRFKDTFALTLAHEMEALRRRQATHRQVVLFVLTRLDSRYSSPTEAQTRLQREIFPWIAKQTRWLLNHSQVAEVAVTGVSALGFGTTELRNGKKNNHARWSTNQSNQNAPEWLLKPDAVVKPFNLRALLGYSLKTALENREAAKLGKSVHKVTELCRQLRDDLDDMNAWYVPVRSR